MTPSRTIQVNALTRVEGEGGLHIRLKGNVIEDLQLAIYEPPRFFEAFLRGRPLNEVPDVVARICGICPIAYQMTAVHAMENALSITVPHEIRQLRRLLYCGEWIESHVLHVHLLHAPDYFGCTSGIQLAERFPQEVTRGLRLKKHGNELLEILGGRAIHPINVAVGGFYRVPRREELARLIPDFQWGLEAAVAATRWVAAFPIPEMSRPYDMVALVHPDEYPMNEGNICSTTGLNLPFDEYENVFEEEQVQHSTALHSVYKQTRACYHVGPLARVNLNFDMLSPMAQQVAAEVGFTVPCNNPFQSIIARCLEVVHAYEEALDILQNYRPFAPARQNAAYQKAEGCAATEAPRGLIYHRYQVDEQGKVTFAKIVPPTSQNQRQMEDDLREYLPRLIHLADAQVASECERLIRCYDPCISCSTHFLKLTVDRG
ncbi:MAG: Ni/Fe hydrogenase subunit alpha [Planctomycetia bacterium]|nr:Ni/Fe hydrogenase subunit alpha [Planctomycetia bacterium]